MTTSIQVWKTRCGSIATFCCHVLLVRSTIRTTMCNDDKNKVSAIDCGKHIPELDTSVVHVLSSQTHLDNISQVLRNICYEDQSARHRNVCVFIRRKLASPKKRRPPTKSESLRQPWRRLTRAIWNNSVESRLKLEETAMQPRRLRPTQARTLQPLILFNCTKRSQPNA